MILSFTIKNRQYCANIFNVSDLFALKNKTLIYLCFNVYNGKVYVGKTTNFINRIKGHYDSAFAKNKNTQFYAALRAHDAHNMLWSVLDILPSSNSIANILEKYYISLYNSEKNGYNMTSGGDGGSTTKGTVWIYNDFEQKMIRKEFFDYYISVGYKKGRKPSTKFNTTKDKIKVHNLKECIFINKNLFNTYKLNGYFKGEIPNDKKGKHFIGRIGIKKDGFPNKFVKKEDLKRYLLDGYSLGITEIKTKSIIGKKLMYKDLIMTYVSSKDIDLYIQMGYKLGMPSWRRKRCKRN